MDNLDALIDGKTESEMTLKIKKKKRKKSKKSLKLQVKQQEEARVQTQVARQKYLEQTKERVHQEWERNKAKSRVYFGEQEKRIRDIKEAFKEIGVIEEKWTEFLREKRKEKEWERFLNCNKLPDATNLPEMNTYKFSWTEVENDFSMAYCLKKTDEVMQLLDELDEEISDPSPGCPLGLINDWKTLRNEMRNLLQAQIDKTTYRLFRKIETDMTPLDITTSQYFCEGKHFAMHLWAELITPIPSTRATERRHPLKVVFRPACLKLTIPVNLLDVHKVIRVMLLNYDQWSDRCRSFNCPEPPTYHSKDLLQLTEEELELRTEIVSFRENLEQIMRKKIAGLPQQSTLSQELLVWDSQPQRILSDEIMFQEEEEEKKWKEQVKMKLSPFEVNLREREFLGGVFIVDILHQPPQPKYLRYKHNVTLLLEPPMLHPVDYHVIYPPPQPNLPENEMDSEESVQKNYELLSQKEKEKLITVELNLPQTVYWFETPQLANWDPLQQCWMTEYVHDVEFVEESENRIGDKTNGSSKHVTFKTGLLGIIGLHVSKFCNLPYEDWCLKSDGHGGVNFQLKAAKITINFNIQGDKVCVKSLEDAPGEPVSGFLNTFYTPVKLAQILRSFGVNVFPEIDASCYIPDFSLKHIVVERHIYQMWGLFSSSFCFRKSKFNRERGRQICIFQLMQVYNQTDVSSFCLVKATPNEAYVLDITESSESYSSEHAPGAQTFANVYDLIAKNCTRDARRKANATSYVLVQTVRDLLSYVRPLSF